MLLAAPVAAIAAVRRPRFATGGPIAKPFATIAIAEEGGPSFVHLADLHSGEWITSGWEQGGMGEVYLEPVGVRRLDEPFTIDVVFDDD